jgi:tripartite-type tricarboxylate transporter receptor subunit TctC
MPRRRSPVAARSRTALAACATAGIAALHAGVAPAAAAYPARPVRLVVPFVPGGPSDVLGRVFAQRLGEQIGQQVIIDNRGGAGGIIGTEIVARAEPDGHTLLFGTIGTHGINSAIYRKLPYDPERDFAPVTLVVAAINLLVVHPSVPAKNVQELVALARAKPGGLSYASAGVGSSQHLAAELLKASAKIDLLHIPYKGGGAALPDLMGGKVQLMFIGISSVQEFVRQGRLRPLAVATPARSPAMPDVPTVAESGYPGFEVGAWHGVLAPRGTPAALVARLHADIGRVTGDAAVKDRFVAMGAIPMASATPEAFAAYIRTEIAKYRKLLADAGIKPE